MPDLHFLLLSDLQHLDVAETEGFFLLEQKELNCYSGNCEIWEVMGEGRGDFWGAKKKRKTQSATLCPPLLWQLFAALPVDTVFLLLSVVCVKSVLSGSHLLRTCKQWVSHFRAQNITRVCSQFFSFFYIFLLGTIFTVTPLQTRFFPSWW